MIQRFCKANYDDKAARMHVYRFRELMTLSLDDMYLSRGSVKLLTTKKDNSFPSFSVPVSEEETSELASALDCDKEFEHTALIAQQQQKLQSSKKQKSSSRKSRQKQKNRVEQSSSPADAKKTEDELIDELLAEIESAGNNSGSSKNRKKGKKNKKSRQKQDVEPVQENGSDSGVADDDVDDEDAGFNSLHLHDANSLVPLGKWIALSSATPPKCVQSVVFSGYNPAPGNRKLAGDLFYLVVETMEDKTFHITARPNGFYINGSTDRHFDPLPARKSHHSHTLMGILWATSSYFRKTFTLLLEARVKKHPFEATPIPFYSPSWLTQQTQHEYDANRAEESFFTMFGGDSRLQQRDFNEELQACRELPSGTMEERIIRDRALFKTHCEFYDFAVKGAKAVVDNGLMPLNPMDPLPAQVFIQNNIFFSFAFDDKKILDPLLNKQYVVDPTTYSNTNNDLHGVRALNEADVRGIHTLASVIVDYKGYRVLAHSVIPGILQGDQGSKHVYGSIDDGNNYFWDEKYHKLLEEAAKKLHIKPHAVLDEKNTEYTMASPAECKGIVGSDGRFYILDYVRPTPRDTNFPDNNAAIFRRELINTWVEKNRQERIQAKMMKKQQEQQLNDEDEAESILDEALDEQEQEDDDEEEEKMSIRFNPDVFIKSETRESFLPETEELEADKRAVKELAQFLKEAVIPLFIREISQVEYTAPLDGHSLTEAMHERGINIRYLGEIATLTEKANVLYMTKLAQEEMVARAAKWEFRKLLIATPELKMLKNIEIFLNCLFSPHDPNNTTRKLDVEYSITQDKISISQYSLMRRLIDHIKQKYQYDLDESFFSSYNPLSLLRSFCLKVGLRISSREYSFGRLNPFSVDDIQGLEPVVKHSVPVSTTAKGLLEVGKKQLQMGQFESAYEFLGQAIVMLQQVRGPMSQDVAQCFAQIAAILHSASEFTQAIMQQHKALIINRRILGIDSTASCHLHQLLGLLCNAINQNEFALKHFLRARYICRIISATGDHHPEMATITSNIGMMYQYLGDTPQSMKYLEEGLRINKKTLGHDSLPTASSYHAIAIVYSLIGDNRKALKCEQESFKILSKVLPKTEQSQELLKESQRWMSQFTSKAVEQQKRTNEMQKQQQMTAARELLRESPYFAAMNKLSKKLGGKEEFMKWMQELQQKQASSGGGQVFQQNILDELANAMSDVSQNVSRSSSSASKSKRSKRSKRK